MLKFEIDMMKLNSEKQSVLEEKISKLMDDKSIFHKNIRQTKIQ